MPTTFRSRRWSFWLALVFLISLPTSLVTLWQSDEVVVMPMSERGEATVIETERSPSTLTIVSVITCVVSCLAFLVSNGIALRKEFRERQQAQLDVEKKILEIEKLKRELREARSLAGQGERLGMDEETG